MNLIIAIICDILFACFLLDAICDVFLMFYHLNLMCVYVSAILINLPYPLLLIWDIFIIFWKSNAKTYH